ncbi:hypothetical protein FBEOM_1112 [Fusarium beomiforme]|uniref:Uncharacterized protein n=1 Tax=Fusarium beomiforme TaxID=44412 RepID=A0A9P5ATQ8_9HYPO|nr:hypothetical protein FBEOM_1112 [Fusarium beomiforme]
MAFLFGDVALTFGALLLLLRKKMSETLPLSAAARMAGINKSLILQFDMPIYLPNPESTSVASYISSVNSVDIFTNEAATRQLAKNAVNFMKEGSRQMIYLGQVWKPLVLNSGHKWPQVIPAEEARSRSWSAYEAIGQPPAEN